MDACCICARPIREWERDEDTHAGRAHLTCTPDWLAYEWPDDHDEPERGLQLYWIDGRAFVDENLQAVA